MAEETTGACPLDRTSVIDSYFLEHRAKLIDVAAFLDRVDRAASPSGKDDFRLKAFRKALSVLLDDGGERARRAQEAFSDHSTEIPQDAKGMKGASGAAPETR